LGVPVFADYSLDSTLKQKSLTNPYAPKIQIKPSLLSIAFEATSALSLC
jgi:hypothetical protein